MPSFTRSLSSLLGLKKGIFFAGTSTFSPVFGLRPMRGLRWRVRKLPKPRISILSPARNERTTLSKIVSTITSLSFRVSSAKRETSSIKSALVITPLFRLRLGNHRWDSPLEFRPHKPLRQPESCPTTFHNLLKFQGFNASYALGTVPRLCLGTPGSLPEVVEPHLLLQHFFPAGQVLRNIAEQKVEQGFALLLRAHQRRFALDSD